MYETRGTVISILFNIIIILRHSFMYSRLAFNSVQYKIVKDSLEILLPLPLECYYKRHAL